MSNPTNVALELVGVDKRFPGVHALKAVSLEVRPGEVVGLIGENGAGKSTLMKILSGVYQPDGGEIRHDGKHVVLRNPTDAGAAGIGMVHQEQSLLTNLSVAENIWLGKEKPFLKGGLIDRKAMADAARKQLAKVQIDVDPYTPTERLTFAQRQMVELAKVLTLEDEIEGHLVIMLDEPTSVLEQAEIDVLFARVRALRDRASFVFVSHRLDEILDLSDRVYVMKDGAVVAEMPAADADTEKLHALMVGRSRNAEYYKENRQVAYRPEVVMEVKGLGVDGAYEDVSFQLHAGEVLGIAGVIGSGREELARTLGGLEPTSKGEITVFGKAARLGSPGEAVSIGIGYVPRERRVEGIVGFLPVVANITLGNLKAVTRAGLIDHAKERATAESWVKRLAIKTPTIRTLAMNLSGGNQQKVVLAKWINAGAKIIVLDHPTRGLDVGAKEEVYELVRKITGEGVAVLLTSDTLEETIGLSHRIIVMKDRRITERFDATPGSKPDQLDLIRHMV
ncbi:MAG TPA: sugar ABC transporter ATP-binding protein [Geminicoccus sp.]|jgi:ribose transport system ATP-binding protein|uniref:sugar ABC transporter ATP-binding protein n=1 Tax=Geminicoccus sp. TaxID=2024832 RepID=UPI002E345934|nr:sugar ABC transporter ATP-binding protein [Geminicoccus sp.]HEX2527147.1 sugar ABC transporter ATP-binding protein [Geminicoccus sp.]